MLGQQGLRGVDELQVEPAGQLAGEPANREAVAAVWGDGEFDDGVAEAEQIVGIGARFGAARLEHEDAGMVTSDAEFGHRADHPVGGVSVGLAGGDREAARQHHARQGHDHQLALGEVGCPADDPAGLWLTDVDLAEADRFLELGEYGDLLHPADHQRSVDVGEVIDLLDLEADAYETGVEFLRGHRPVRCGPLQHLGQPGLRYSHGESLSRRRKLRPVRRTAR